MFHELMIFYCLKFFVFNLILAVEVSGSYEALKPQRSQILRVYSLFNEPKEVSLLATNGQ